MIGGIHRVDVYSVARLREYERKRLAPEIEPSNGAVCPNRPKTRSWGVLDDPPKG